MFKNIGDIKTTILGGVLIGAGLALQYLLYKEAITTINYFTIGLVAVGIVLILLPDAFLSAVQQAIQIGVEHLKKIW